MAKERLISLYPANNDSVNAFFVTIVWDEDKGFKYEVYEFTSDGEFVNEAEHGTMYDAMEDLTKRLRELSASIDWTNIAL